MADFCNFTFLNNYTKGYIFSYVIFQIETRKLYYKKNIIKKRIFNHFIKIFDKTLFSRSKHKYISDNIIIVSPRYRSSAVPDKIFVGFARFMLSDLFGQS